MRLLPLLISLFLIFSVPVCLQSQTTAVSKQQQALTLLKKTTLSANSVWASVNPQLFLQNLQRNIDQPVFLYAGRNTNFCSFAVIGYMISRENPLSYVEFMIELYKKGKAEFAGVTYRPSAAVRKQVGRVLYEGELDRNDADQMLFFTLADHFKGYLNLFHLNYKEGRELGLWAATNLAKFNDMLRVTMKAEIQCLGYDLIRAKLKKPTAYLQEKLALGDVFLYLNNSILRKKNHRKFKKHIPTHYVVLKNIQEENGIITMTYWDAGFTTQRQIETRAFRSLLFGVSWSIRKKS
jgi:hypothetical protein